MCPIIWPIGLNHLLKDCRGMEHFASDTLTAKLWLSVSREQMNGLKRENDGRLLQSSTAIRIIAANFLNVQRSAPLILCVAVMR